MASSFELKNGSQRFQEHDRYCRANGTIQPFG